MAFKRERERSHLINREVSKDEVVLERVAALRVSLDGSLKALDFEIYPNLSTFRHNIFDHRLDSHGERTI
jgi:hypothetical protein